MADPSSHLEPASGAGLATQSPSIGPSSRGSAEIAGSQENLLSGNAVEDRPPAREIGDSVPDAPARVEEVVAENPAHATNRQLGM